jgi:hypothetical protein
MRPCPEGHDMHVLGVYNDERCLYSGDGAWRLSWQPVPYER